MNASSPDPIDRALLFRFVSGAASPHECDMIEQWMQLDPRHRAQVESLERLWKMAGRLPGYQNAIDDLWGRLSSRIGRDEMETADPHDGAASARPLVFIPVSALRRRFVMMPSVSRRIMGGRVVAAAAILVVLGGVPLLRMMRSAATSSGAGAASRNSALPMNEVATVRGQRATVRLSDGSRIIIGAASRMRYPRDFGTNTRDLELEGEAYFEVAHDARLPFRVHTVHGVTEDLGTRFAVRAYADDSAARIVVTEGRVSVGEGVLLGAGDMARVAVGFAPVVRHGVALAPLLAWTTGQPEFSDTPLREAAADLERWYNITIRISDPELARRVVTARFHNATAHTALAITAGVVGAKVEQQGDTYVLVPVLPSVRHTPPSVPSSIPIR